MIDVCIHQSLCKPDTFLFFPTPYNDELDEREQEVPQIESRIALGTADQQSAMMQQQPWRSTHRDPLDPPRASLLVTT